MSAARWVVGGSDGSQDILSASTAALINSLVSVVNRRSVHCKLQAADIAAVTTGARRPYTHQWRRI